MSFPLEQQTIYFLFSLLFGVLLSMLYDVVRVLRFSGLCSITAIIITDILYFICCAFFTFLFALPFNNGGVRYFVLLGQAVGFIVYRFTLGEVNARFYCAFVAILRKIFKKSLKYVAVFFNKLLKANGFLVYNVGVLIRKIQNIVFRKKDNI